MLVSCRVHGSDPGFISRRRQTVLDNLTKAILGVVSTAARVSNGLSVQIGLQRVYCKSYQPGAKAPSRMW